MKILFRKEVEFKTFSAIDSEKVSEVDLLFSFHIQKIVVRPRINDIWGFIFSLPRST